MLLQEIRSKGLGNKIDRTKGLAPVSSSQIASNDRTASLNDQIMLQILGSISEKPNQCCLVCKRWLHLQGMLRNRIVVKEWNFLESGLMVRRFPNLVCVDLTQAWLSRSMPIKKSNSIIFTHHFIKVQLEPHANDPTSIESSIQKKQISPSSFDRALGVLADGCPSLQCLRLVNVRRPTHDSSTLGGNANLMHADENVIKDCNAMGSEHQIADEKMINNHVKYEEEDVKKARHSGGLAYLAKKCDTLQELILLNCTDDSLSAISTCKNLQILQLVGIASVFYRCTFTDIGLTILAKGCCRLVKLGLSGCEASYDGIVAIGKCCIMLEELIISNQNFTEGWIAALSYFSCLKKLRLENCKHINLGPRSVEDAYPCVTLHQLELVRCNLRDRAGFSALVVIAASIKELLFENCWGLDDDALALAKSFRELRFFSIEGCYDLTTTGLEAVVATWKDLQTLHVVHCSSIKDSEISPKLAQVFSNLKILKWRPNMSSLFANGLA